jgi:putative membrane protein
MHIRYPMMALGIIGASLAANFAFADNLTRERFVTKASIANQFEIQSSRLALDKAQNQEVKSYAQQMVDDHTKTGEKLNEILSSSGAGLKPAEELDSKHQKLMDKLETASDKDFDREYIRIQTDAHKEAVNLFSTYSISGKDSVLKSFAANTLPTLEQHLERVQSLNVDD